MKQLRILIKECEHKRSIFRDNMFNSLVVYHKSSNNNFYLKYAVVKEKVIYQEKIYRKSTNFWVFHGKFTSRVIQYITFLNITTVITMRDILKQ